MRFIRVATLQENDPHAFDLGITSPGKIIIQNFGSNDIIIGQDRGDVLAATASNYLTIPAGVMLVFDVGPEIGFLGQRQMVWFNAVGGSSTLEIAIFGVQQ
tara:strand:- start:95 stop:397 length:303 start_codon:yes stop_codon:yes gene_type:complete